MTQFLTSSSDINPLVALGGDYKSVLDGLADFRLLVDNLFIILSLTDGVFIYAVDFYFVHVFQPTFRQKPGLNKKPIKELYT